jgi:hypothetical protein
MYDPGVRLDRPLSLHEYEKFSDVSVFLILSFLLFAPFTGNLGRVDRINDFEYDLFVRPDSANPRFRLWFNFTIENVQENQVIL